MNVFSCIMSSLAQYYEKERMNGNYTKINKIKNTGCFKRIFTAFIYFIKLKQNKVAKFGFSEFRK